MTWNTLLCPHCRSSVFIRMFVLFCPPPGSPSRTGNAKLSLHQLRGLDGEKLNSSALAGDDGWSQTESRLMVNKQNGALTEFVHFKPDNHNYNPPLLFPSVTRRRMGRNWKKLDTRRPKKQDGPFKKEKRHTKGTWSAGSCAAFHRPESMMKTLLHLTTNLPPLGRGVDFEWAWYTLNEK